MSEPFTMSDRENELINLAMDQAETQLRTGHAPISIVNHFLKLGCTRYQYETERLRSDTELAKARIEAIKSAEHIDEMYQRAIDAMKTYSGSGE